MPIKKKIVKKTTRKAPPEDKTNNPKGGGQYNNNNAEKWTEEKALELGNDLIEWLKVDDTSNIIFAHYLISDRDLYPALIGQLCQKFDSFLKIIRKARQLQQLKIEKYGLKNKINIGMGAFLLKAKHGLREDTVKDDFQIESKTDESAKFITTANEVTDVYLQTVDGIQRGYPIINNRGGTRSSKTYSECQIMIDFLFTGKLGGVEISSNRIGFFRRTLPALKTTILKDILEVFDNKSIRVGIDVQWHQTGHYFERDGRYIHYGSLNSLADLEKAKGFKLGAFLLNEANAIKHDYFLQLYMRGEKNVIAMLDYNPDDASSWVNKVIELQWGKEKKTVKTIQSTYLNNRFLSDEQVSRIEKFKQRNPHYWKIYGKGQYGVAVGQIYPDWKTYKTLPQGEYVTALGEDFGFANSKDAIVEVNWLKGTNKLYVKELLYSSGLKPSVLVELNKDLGEGKIIYADCNEARMISSIRDEGVNIFRPKKSILTDIRRVQRFDIYYQEDSENLQMEGSGYKWLLDDIGKPTNVPIDQDDHLMKAKAYAVNGLVNHQKIKLPSIKD